MTDATFNLLAILGGVLIFILLEFTFKFKAPRILHVIGFMLAAIPVAGIFAGIFFYMGSILSYQTDGFCEGTEIVQVRGTALNKWLFNDVNWTNWQAAQQDINN